ncbi:hypothetical protein DL93DRAFT_2044644, partial [Clavulina sp. PMI_390]
RVRQLFDAFLVVDVEGTCHNGSNFDYPNEIIEFPVVLLRWEDADQDRRASRLVKVSEFRSLCRPTWRPRLTDFCTALTGITQDDIDQAPEWPQVVEEFDQWLAANGLIDLQSGQRLQKFIFCCDGPFDIRDFVPKQSFISKTPMRDYFLDDILDVRKAVQTLGVPMPSTATNPPRSSGKRLKMDIHRQLSALGLDKFEGRHHSGIDDARNIARVLTHLGEQGIRLYANTFIYPDRKWEWMKRGEV